MTRQIPGYKFITALCPNLKPTWSKYRCQGSDRLNTVHSQASTGVIQCIQIQKAQNQEVQVTVGGNLSPKSNFRAWVWPIQETGQSRKLANGGTDVLAFDDRSRQSHIVGRTQVLPSAPTHFFKCKCGA